MEQTYITVWTPIFISRFVTQAAVNDGGRIIKAFRRECDALMYAAKLNVGTTSGYYCMMVTTR